MATDNIARGLAAHALSVAQAGGGDHPVESVNGKTGKVNLTAVDVGAEPAGSVAKFIINLTEDVGNGTYTADKTWEQIKSAYESSKILAVHIKSSELPLMNGQIAESGDAGFTFGYTNIILGGNTVSTRAIHYLHNADGDKWEDADKSGEYLPVSGGAMLGSLTLASSPVNEHEAADKAYVDGRVFKVTFTRDQVAGLNADKTIEEVNSAISNGKIVIGILDSNEYRLAYYNNGEIIFSGISGSISTNIMYTNNAWSQTTETMLSTSGGTMTGDIDMGGRKITNAQKIHVDGNAPLYLGSTIEASGTSGTRLTGTTAGAAAFVKADTQADYVPVYVGTPTDNNHSANKKYVDDAVSGRLPIVPAQAGQLKAYLQNGTSPDVCIVSDNGSASSIVRYTSASQIVANPAPTADNHVANKKYVDDVAAKELPLTGGTISGNLMVGGNLSVSGTMSALKAPTNDVDVCNKAYVDGIFSYDSTTKTLTITTA
nr:MAG TPA: hyaluronase tail fiber protein [Caudoviricetes sp.]